MHYKEDFLMKLILDFMEKFNRFISGKEDPDPFTVRENLNVCFNFYDEKFDIKTSASEKEILEKLPAIFFIEEYAVLLKHKYELDESKNINDLEKALYLVDYVSEKDKTYSWEREVLRQDILRLLDKTG